MQQQQKDNKKGALDLFVILLSPHSNYFTCISITTTGANFGCNGHNLLISMEERDSKMHLLQPDVRQLDKDGNVEMSPLYRVIKYFAKRKKANRKFEWSR